MSKDYTAIAEKAAVSIAANGKPAVVITHPEEDDTWKKKFDGTTGKWYWMNADTDEIIHNDPFLDERVNCAVLELSFRIGQIDGTTVRADDRLFICNVEPKIGDRILIDEDAQPLKIVMVQPFKPGRQTIYAEIQARNE